MPKRELNGAELTGFIKERQAKQVRMLRQAHRIVPTLVVIMSEQADDVIRTYVRMKQRFAADILIDVKVVECAADEMRDYIQRYNADESVQGIIVQLPVAGVTDVQPLLDTIAPEKDVDGLGVSSTYISATADAIDWLLAGYGVNLDAAQIVIVGNGMLVGRPLAQLWRSRGLHPTALDKTTPDIAAEIKKGTVLVSATGSARVITSDMVQQGAVVVDAGTVSEDGVIVGDVDDAVRERSDVTITPVRGGVGPLTITLLFDHLIRACLAKIQK